MKSLKEIAEWFHYHDKHIIDRHLKKDRRSLKKTLFELEEERREFRGLLHRLEHIVEEEETEKDTEWKLTREALKADFFFHGEELVEIEKRFAEFRTKKPGQFSSEEREFLVNKLPEIAAGKRRLDNRLRKLDEIITKTKILLNDLNEDLCRELSRGQALSAVRQLLLDHFGHELKEDHGPGRRTIRRFLQEHYNIDRSASRTLFSLLEDVGTLRYRLDLPEEIKRTVPGIYSWQEDNVPQPYIGLGAKLYGVWEIRENFKNGS